MLFSPTSLFVWYSVPQGSVLCLLLFILHTQPLSNIIEQRSVLRHIIFVDDEELYSSTHRLALILGFVFGAKLTFKNHVQYLKISWKKKLTFCE